MKKLDYFRYCLILFSLIFISFNVLAQSGSWTKFGDMPENRYAHTVNEINGKIFLVGGTDNEFGYLPTTALVYDTSSKIWSQMSLYNSVNRNCHNSAVIDGKLYVVGGNNGIRTVATMEMFDPDSGKWISKTSMPTDRGIAACATTDGKIYVIGGIRGTLPGNFDLLGVNTVEVYDTKIETWSQVKSMPTKRWGCTATAANGKIYVFGGVSFGGPGVYATVEEYDPQTNTWTTKSARMPTPRYCLTSCMLDSLIYVIGGWYHSTYGPLYDKVEVYNPATDEWKTGKSLPAKLAGLASTVINGKIYVFGGARTTHPNYGTSVIYEFSVVTGIDEEEMQLSAFRIYQNYPNPFNPITTIKYSIPKESFVNIKVYDILGKEITTLINERKSPGNYSIDFNGVNLPSGVYFYRMQAGSFVSTKKFVLLK